MFTFLYNHNCRDKLINNKDTWFLGGQFLVTEFARFLSENGSYENLHFSQALSTDEWIM
jgi:hypothetical protein